MKKSIYRDAHYSELQDLFNKDGEPISILEKNMKARILFTYPGTYNYAPASLEYVGDSVEIDSQQFRVYQVQLAIRMNLNYSGNFLNNLSTLNPFLPTCLFLASRLNNNLKIFFLYFELLLWLFFM